MDGTQKDTNKVGMIYKSLSLHPFTLQLSTCTDIYPQSITTDHPSFTKASYEHFYCSYN